MNPGGDAADSMGRATVELSVEALKLIGLGAKNLAALLIALLQENQNHGETLRGQHGITSLLRTGKPLTTFTIKAEDFKRFSETAAAQGILFTGVKDKISDSGMMDIVAKAEDASRINTIIERMEYPVPSKEGGEKNDNPRDPSGSKLTERGNGLWEKIMGNKGRITEQEAANMRAILEQLPPHILAAMTHEIASANKDLNAPIAQLVQEGGDLQTSAFEARGRDIVALNEKLKTLEIPALIRPTGERNQWELLAHTENASLINSVYKLAGMTPPMKELPPQPPQQIQPQEKQKRGPGRPPGSKNKPKEGEHPPSVKGKLDKIKEDQTEGKGREKAPKKEAEKPKEQATKESPPPRQKRTKPPEKGR